MKGLGDMLEQSYNLIIGPSEFMESLRLPLKDFSEGLDGVTAIELEGQWMSSERGVDWLSGRDSWNTVRVVTEGMDTASYMIAWISVVAVVAGTKQRHRIGAFPIDL
ncbi:hypothetical protein BJV74DRAFT_799077 [Russula compacta]|nr:hypothetical protein BJV74DRAFT_799077 [Russula compacta]